MEQVNGLPFNHYTWLTTHNSFAVSGTKSPTGSPILGPANQEDDVASQLKVRQSYLSTFLKLMINNPELVKLVRRLTQALKVVLNVVNEIKNCWLAISCNKYLILICSRLLCSCVSKNNESISWLSRSHFISNIISLFEVELFYLNVTQDKLLPRLWLFMVSFELYEIVVSEMLFLYIVD